MKPCLCTQMTLSPGEALRAMNLAIKENPENAKSIDAVKGQLGITSLSETNIEPLLALPRASMWLPGRTLRVKLLEGASANLKGKIRRYASEWTDSAHIYLDFVDQGDAEIRVGFSGHPDYWSFVGTDALGVDVHDWTMCLGDLSDTTDEAVIRSTVLHEFGHALGCIHEHQSPAEGIEWNKPAVYAYYEAIGWSPEKVDSQIFFKYSRSQTQFSEFDKDSVMIYPIPKELTLNGFSVGWNTLLSPVDKSFISKAYPPTLYLLHRGAGAKNSLWLNSLRNGAWTGEQNATGVGLGGTPAPVFFRGKLYVLHCGENDSENLWCSVYDGHGWREDRVSGVTLSGSPSAAVFNDKIYCVHAGAGDKKDIFYTVFDGNAWSTDQGIGGASGSGSPVLTSYKGKLYCIHQGAKDRSSLWYSTFDGKNWSGDANVAGSSTGGRPAAAAFKDKLYVFHAGNGDTNSAWCTSFDGGTGRWTGDTPLPARMSGDPAAGVLNNTLYCFHAGATESSSLWYAAFDGTNWVGDQHVPGVSLSYSVGVTSG